MSSGAPQATREAELEAWRYKHMYRYIHTLRRYASEALGKHVCGAGTETNVEGGRERKHGMRGGSWYVCTSETGGGGGQRSGGCTEIRTVEGNVMGDVIV